MKVLLKFDSFIAVSHRKLSIFTHRKCRIRIQILHFKSDKHNFNKLLSSAALLSFRTFSAEVHAMYTSDTPYLICHR